MQDRARGIVPKVNIEEPDILGHILRVLANIPGVSALGPVEEWHEDLLMSLVSWVPHIYKESPSLVAAEAMMTALSKSMG